ncbi:MAG: septal ring lytic transglycosylase RlpA family protein [Rhodothermales bacterium]|nr:septal ring lytic transglycosylase RlpA family protein [Rhodothermales bacterium]
MNPADLACTAPARWPAPPLPDAPDDEVLAYLRHCETCPHHAAHERRRDLPLDVLLMEATGGLPVQPVVALPPPPRRARILPMAWKALAAAAVLAGMAVGLPRLAGDRSTPERPPSIAEAPAVRQPSLPGQTVGEGGRLMWYAGGVISPEREGRYTGSGVRYDAARLVAAAARLPFGSQLRVVNPANGRSIVVTLIDRGTGDGRLHLSTAAAEALGYSGAPRMLLVEVLSTPNTAIGP